MKKNEDRTLKEIRIGKHSHQSPLPKSENYALTEVQLPRHSHQIDRPGVPLILET